MAAQSNDFIASGGPPPEETTSLFGHLIFSYMSPLLRLGFKKPIESVDVWELAERNKSQAQVDKFLKAWEFERERAQKRADDTGRSIKSFRPHLRALWRVWGTDFLKAFFPRHTGMQARMGFHMRMGLISVAFRKMLRLSPSARADLTTGKIINVIVSDTNRIDLATANVANIYSAPYIIIVASALLIWNLGPVALVGLAILVAYIPCQNWIQKTMGVMRTRTNKVADQRIRIITETLGGIRVVKAYAWEQPFAAIISALRIRELSTQRIYLLFRSGVSAASQVVPTFAMVASFVCYVAIGNTLNPASVFASLSLFYVLRSPLLMIPLTISMCTDAWIGIDRLEDLFLAEELKNGPKMLPAADDTNEEERDLPAISIKNADFQWISVENAPTQTAAGEQALKKGGSWASKDGAAPDGKADAVVEITEESNAPDEPFSLEGVNLDIPRGQLVAIIGTVGSGKSSFLQALVGEMEKRKGEVTIRGSVGWCPQTAWILNQTLKENVLFGQLASDEARYQEVIDQCALRSDLKILPGGDQTEIGEKGINLSGGQKQRLSLARAVYFGADVVLLDDPMSAVDSTVGRHLFTHCIRGALRDKTVVLVTHQLHFLPQVDRVLMMDKGRIVEDGTYEELMAIENGRMRVMMEEFGGVEEKKQDHE
ncbi:hypothetical protein HK101_001964, partial [Irineochytrium annulatum]